MVKTTLHMGKDGPAVVTRNGLARVGILTIAYNEEQFISGCIRQWQPYGFKHLVLLSTHPWHGPYRKPDKTNDIATSLGAEVICGQWPSEADQRNFGLRYFKDYDWVLIVDADEFYTHEGQDIILSELDTPAEVLLAANMKVYWKTPDHRILPDQEDAPIIAARPHIKFVRARQADCTRDLSKTTLHHLSYVRDDMSMMKKLESFEHAPEFDIFDWFERVWLDWTEEMTGLHPINPMQFYKTTQEPLPKEIKQFL